MKAAFIPQVNDELDTQNFEKFEEVNMLIPDVYIYIYIYILKYNNLDIS